MKTLSLTTLVTAALMLSYQSSQAQTTYFSQNGAWANGGGYSDGAGISSVVVNNDANNISFTINTSQPLDAYPELFILIQDVGLGGSGSTALLNSAGALNGWGPSLGISTGENAFIATWNGLGGGSAETYNSGWTQNYSAAGAVSAGGVGDSFITLTVPISSLGLTAGSQFYFDAVSSYGSPTGQAAYNALDTLTHPEETDGASTPWNGTSAYDAATDPAGTVFGTSTSEYTVTAAPEPATGAMLGLGALIALRNLRSKKQ